MTESKDKYAFKTVTEAGFTAYLKAVEGSHKTKDGKLALYDSPEGGRKTVGYGHKCKDEAEEKKYASGVTETDASKLLAEDVQAHRKSASAKVGDATFSKLDYSRQCMLVDFAFNGVLGAFPNFAKAVCDGKAGVAYAECTRYYTDKSGAKKELVDRNKRFRETFFSVKA